MAGNQCSHPGCRCTAQTGQAFCSDHCANATSHSASEKCGCGHPQCANR